MPKDPYTYRRLRATRIRWRRRKSRSETDRTGITIELNGSLVSDIPSFYTALGEAVNGPGGYYGGCLDALDDCLCGGFSLVPPFTLEISEMHSVEKAIENSKEAWNRRYIQSLAECDALVLSEGEDEESILGDVAHISYFQSLLDLFASRGVLIREA